MPLIAGNIDKVKKLPEGKYAKLYCLYADRTSTDNITWVTPSDIVITDTDHFQGRYVNWNILGIMIGKNDQMIV